MAGRFALDITRFVEKAKGRLDLVLRKVTLDVGRQVILMSPVGNPDLWQSDPPPGYTGGTFRANWQTAVSAPDLTTNDDPDPTGQAAIGQLRTVVAGVDFGQAIYITNDLPYAEPLENGWSAQAPSGMVKVVVANYPGIVRESTFEAKRERP